MKGVYLRQSNLRVNNIRLLNHALWWSTTELKRWIVVKIFSQHAEFVFDGIHKAQANTPIENIVVMIVAIKKFNKATV